MREVGNPAEDPNDIKNDDPDMSTDTVNDVKNILEKEITNNFYNKAMGECKIYDVNAASLYHKPSGNSHNMRSFDYQHKGAFSQDFVLLMTMARLRGMFPRYFVKFLARENKCSVLMNVANDDDLTYTENAIKEMMNECKGDSKDRDVNAEMDAVYGMQTSRHYLDWNNFIDDKMTAAHFSNTPFETDGNNASTDSIDKELVNVTDIASSLADTGHTQSAGLAEPSDSAAGPDKELRQSTSETGNSNQTGALQQTVLALVNDYETKPEDLSRFTAIFQIQSSLCLAQATPDSACNVDLMSRDNFIRLGGKIEDIKLYIF